MTEIQLKAKRERDAKAKRDKRAAVKLAAKDAAVDPTEVLVLDAPQTQAEAEALVEQKAAPLVKVLPVKTDSDKNAKRLVGLSGFVAKKKASLKQKPVEAAATEAPKAARGKDPAAPLNIILYAAGFKFMGKEEVDGAIASGYTHADGRAALVTVKDGEAVWMTNPGETGYEAGSTAESLTTALIMRDTLLTQTVQSINKKLSGEGRLTGVKDKIAEQKDALAKAAPQPATLLKTLPDGTPAATARAVEMLGGLTLQRFDLAPKGLVLRY